MTSFTSQVASADFGFHKFESDFRQSRGWEAYFDISYTTKKANECKAALRAERRVDGEWKTVVAGHGHTIIRSSNDNIFRRDPQDPIGCGARLRRGDIPEAWPKLRRVRCSGERIRLFMQASVYELPEDRLVHHEDHIRWMKKPVNNPTMDQHTYNKYKDPEDRFWCGRATVVEDE